MRALAVPWSDINNLRTQQLQLVPLEVVEDGGNLKIDAGSRFGMWVPERLCQADQLLQVVGMCSEMLFVAAVVDGFECRVLSHELTADCVADFPVAVLVVPFTLFSITAFDSARSADFSLYDLPGHWL